jgi:hypothetical protein
VFEVPESLVNEFLIKMIDRAFKMLIKANKKI